MRELIARLLPEIGVPSVPGVPVNEDPQNTGCGSIAAAGTPDHVPHVPGVLPAVSEHGEHHRQNSVFREKGLEISARILGTHGTPDLVEDRAEAYEERAAIMEFDGGMTRAEAEEKAKDYFL